MKIGILTCHYYPNFGSTLQAIALQNTILKLGNSVKLINYHNPIHRNKSWIKRLIKLLASFFSIESLDKMKSIRNFQKKYQLCTKEVCDMDGLIEVCKDFDVVVCGSDQIWSPAHFFPVYFANFICKDSVKKVSYAASIGTEDIPSELVPEFVKLVSDFDLVSVREEKAKELLKDKCQIESTVVLDPTFLLDVEEYRVMEEKPSGIDAPFVFCYFLNANNEYKDKVIKYANNHNLKVVGVSEKKEDSLWMKNMHINAGEFLWLIDHAESVFTDSYHGTIFSMLFHKQFWEFMRFRESDLKSENSRIKQLDNYFNISSRILKNDAEPSDKLIFDYNYFDNQLKSLKCNSFSFLQNAIR